MVLPLVYLYTEAHRLPESGCGKREKYEEEREREREREREKERERGVRRECERG